MHKHRYWRFDGDGKDDLALVRPADPTANDSGDVTIFLNNGDGTLRQGQVITFDKNPASGNHAILALDLNGDRRLDLAVAHFDEFSVLLGNGNGTFQSPIAYSAFAGSPPIGLATVDLAGNGEKDLALFGALSIDLWLSNGDGTFRHGPYLKQRRGCLGCKCNRRLKGSVSIAGANLNLTISPWTNIVSRPSIPPGSSSWATRASLPLSSPRPTSSKYSENTSCASGRFGFRRREA